MSTLTIPRPSVFVKYEPTLTASGPIIVASDLSTDSDAAFVISERLGERKNSAVQVMSVLRPTTAPVYGFDTVQVPFENDAVARTARRAALREQMTRTVKADTDWGIMVATGEPMYNVSQRARMQKAQLVVVGRGRHSTFERFVGRDSVLRLLQVGDTPVLAVAKELTQLPKRVVVATDFSPFSLYAARVAIGLIAPDAVVHLVNVRPTNNQADALRHDLDAEYEMSANAVMDQMVEILKTDGMTFDSTLLVGDTAEELRKFLLTSNADLVVLATHGFGFMRRLVLGSLAAAMVHSAPCSVLCVPGSARATAEARARSAGTSATHQLEPQTFDAELASFTKRNAGRHCAVEVDEADIGAQQLGHDLPLIGATFDRHTDAASLMFGTSGFDGPHLTHSVAGVTAIAIASDANGEDHSMRLVHSGGQTLLLLN